MKSAPARCTAWGVSLTYLGDGAVNQGQVHEAFNMAELWDLPVIYIIENNRYGMGTSVARASAAKELYRLGEPYGMPGEQVDGMDVLAVNAAAQKAVKHCRDGKGPYVLEMLTYRYRGHSMSDPAKYRTKEEVADMRENHDPIANLSKKIVEAGHKTERDRRPGGRIRAGKPRARSVGTLYRRPGRSLRREGNRKCPLIFSCPRCRRR